jgi:hypothetical protein
MLGPCFMIGAAAALGLLLGRFYRVPALAAGSAVVAAALFAAGALFDLSAYAGAMLALSGLSALQACYVVGVLTRSVIRCRRAAIADHRDRFVPRSESRSE